MTAPRSPPLVSDVASLPHGPELAQLHLYAADGEEEALLCGEGDDGVLRPRLRTDGGLRRNRRSRRHLTRLGDRSRVRAPHREQPSGRNLVRVRCGHPALEHLRARLHPAIAKGSPSPATRAFTTGKTPARAFAPVLLPARRSAEHLELLAALRAGPDRPAQAARRRGRTGRTDRDDLDSRRARTARIARGSATRSRLGPTSAATDLRVPYDGRIRVRLHPTSGSFHLALVDPATGATVAEAGPGAGGVTRLRYADCGLRAPEAGLEAAQRGRRLLLGKHPPPLSFRAAWFPEVRARRRSRGGRSSVRM